MSETSVEPIKLFSPEQVAIATFLGSPVAGCILLALNYRTLGQTAMVSKIIIMGVVVSTLMLVLGYFLPNAFGMGFAMAGVIGMYAGAKKAPGMDYEGHFGTGGKKGSAWMVAGVGLGCLCAIFLILFIIVFVTGIDLK